VVFDLPHIEEERGQGPVQLAGNGGSGFFGGSGAGGIQSGELELFVRRSATIVPIRRPRISNRFILMRMELVYGT
jgi:hypothetical protein